MGLTEEDKYVITTVSSLLTPNDYKTIGRFTSDTINKEQVILLLQLTRDKLTEDQIECLERLIDTLLTYQQNRILREITDGENNMYIMGDAGTGKSTLIRNVITRLRALKVCFGLTAMTWQAALLLEDGEARSLHSYLNLGMADKPIGVYYAYNKKSDEWKHTKILIIEEASMLSAPLLRLIHDLARSIRYSDKPFGGMRLILFGDPKQLAAVNAPSIDKDSDLFGEFDLRILTHNFRQKSDILFRDIVSRIGRGTQTEDDISVLRTRITQNIPDDIPHIFSTNAEAAAHNATMLAKINAHNYVYTTSIHITGTPPKYLAEKIRKSVPAAVTIKVGAKVILTKTIDIELGWCNCSVLRVRSANALYVVLEDNKGISRDIEIMDMHVFVNQPNKKQFKITIRGMPFKLAYGITIHKSMGMSLERACLSLSRTFTHGQNYVAFGRVCSLAGVYIKSMPEKWIVDKHYLKITRIAEAHERKTRRQILKYYLAWVEYLYSPYTSPGKRRMLKICEECADMEKDRPTSGYA